MPEPFSQPESSQVYRGMHGAVKTLADMTPQEVAAIERQYGMPVVPRLPQVAEDFTDGGGHARDESGGGMEAHEDAVPVVEAKKKKSA